MAENKDNVYRRLDRHEEIHKSFDSRISKNEEWRLQMQGALGFAAFALGSGIATTIVLIVLGVV